MGSIKIEFSQAELDEILEFMDMLEDCETIQAAIIIAVREAGKSIETK